MRKSLAITYLLILFFTELRAQQTDYSFIPYRKGSLWGFCDSTKRILIKPLYDSVDWMKIYKTDPALPASKIALVVKNGKYGVINEKGKVLVPLICTEATWNYPDTSGNRGILLKVKNTLSVFYPQTGRTLPARPDMARYFGDARLISSRFDCASNISYLQISKVASGQFLLAKKRSDPSGGYAWDSLAFHADEVRNTYCSNEYFFFKKNDKWGAAQIIPTPGPEHRILDTIHVQPAYDSIKWLPPFSDFIVSKDKSWYLIRHIYRQMPGQDYRQEVQILGPYEGISDEVDNEDGVDVVVKKNGKWGIILDNEGSLALVDKVRFNKYDPYTEGRLIAVYDTRQKRVGFCHFNGTRYWD